MVLLACASLAPFVFQGGADGARSVLGTIAGAMISVRGAAMEAVNHPRAAPTGRVGPSRRGIPHDLRRAAAWQRGGAGAGA